MEQYELVSRQFPKAALAYVGGLTPHYLLSNDTVDSVTIGFETFEENAWDNAENTLMGIMWLLKTKHALTPKERVLTVYPNAVSFKSNSIYYIKTHPAKVVAIPIKSESEAGAWEKADGYIKNILIATKDTWLNAVKTAVLNKNPKLRAIYRGDCFNIIDGNWQPYSEGATELKAWEGAADYYNTTVACYEPMPYHIKTAKDYVLGIYPNAVNDKHGGAYRIIPYGGFDAPTLAFGDTEHNAWENTYNYLMATNIDPNKSEMQTQHNMGNNSTTPTEDKAYVLEKVPGAVSKHCIIPQGFNIFAESGMRIGFGADEASAWKTAAENIKSLTKEEISMADTSKPFGYQTKGEPKADEPESADAETKGFVLSKIPDAFVKWGHDTCYIYAIRGGGNKNGTMVSMNDRNIIGWGSTEYDAWESAKKDIIANGAKYQKSIYMEEKEFVLSKKPDACASVIAPSGDMPELWHIIDCAESEILGWGKTESIAWINASDTLKERQEETKPVFKKIYDLSFSNLVDIIQNDVSVAADVLDSLAHELEYLDKEKERIEGEFNKNKSRRGLVISGADKILSIIKKTTPLTVQRQGYTIVVLKNHITINKNVI